ncbi:MAG: glycosyltransferase family 39 protein [Candidatus Omnitrophota bacterium]|nr:glycosyltransferase family 39 protein [Candidatus Omnitrophota bacterium]
MRIFLSLLTYLSLLLIVQSNRGYVPLTLVAADIYIPVYYWLVLFVYTFIYALYAKIKFSGILANMLILGVFLHIDLMLLGLNHSLLSNSYYARMYIGYAFLLETVLFAGSAYFFFQKAGSKYTQKDFYLYLPLGFNLLYHLYRDMRYIAPAYFVFHLGLLLCAYFACKNKPLILRPIRAAAGFLKKERTIIILIFLFAFAARAIFAVHIIQVTAGAFPTASDDGPTYHDQAVLITQNIANLVSAKKIIPGAYDPGYSMFLGLIYKIFGPNFYAAALIQSALNALMVVFIYLIAKEIFNRNTGIIAAVLTAANQPLIMLSAVLTTEALSIPLFVFSIYCLLRFSKNARARSGSRWLFAAGLSLGVAIVTRAMLLLFPFIAVLWMLLYVSGSRWIKASTIFAAGILPAMIGVIILTYTNTGQFKMFTSKQDPNWIAFTENEGGRYIDPRHVYSNAKLIEMGINPFRDPKGALLIALKNPLKILKIESEILPKRLKLFLFYPPAGYFDPVFILASTTPNQYASTMGFYALLILVIGMVYVAADKRRVLQSSLPAVVLVYYLIIHVGLTTGQCWRYRIPLHPFFMIFAACGLCLIYKNIIRGPSIKA